jgi:hypothetical protein
MSSVYEEGVECPVCGANTARKDLNCRTNEVEYICDRCGFFSETKIVERAGRKFWQWTLEMPMSQDGKVAWPKMPAVEGGGWNMKMFGIRPSYEKDEKVVGGYEPPCDCNGLTGNENSIWYCNGECHCGACDDHEAVKGEMV